tara:strand:- start:784 stop:1086 length:303 start_codon:yes stop_codon:yes gene_type:complete
MTPFDHAFDFLEKKLCPEGKAAAKRKFKVYPSAYANGWAVQYCRGKFKKKKGKVKKAEEKPTATIGHSFDRVQRVLTKLMSGEPLTPEEEAILNQRRQQI